MLSDKEVKKELRKVTAANPEKYYAVEILKKNGFSRFQCEKCQKYFWSINPSKVCGDPACSGGFRFIGSSPAKHKMTYVETWQRFSELFESWGYTPIKRYPVAARWRDDTDFVQASIYDFQPFVVSGQVEPPANPLVVPQFCLRFNDIDNVGITGAHYTGFVMIGQHAFMSPENFDQKKYFTDIYNWLTEGLGISKEEITFHEDAWAGGGNAGICMEFFSRGLELGNQVYMKYEVTEEGLKPLKLNILDMGMGHERNAWFSNGTGTSYDAVFPKVMNHLYKTTGFHTDPELMKKFLPYASYLNADEVEDIENVWDDISKKISVPKDELKEKIAKSAALYSIAEHSRSLLFAISDGVLPSNVAGGYNLRIILRRALSLIEKNKWDISLPDLCKIHAQELKPLFPELSENLKEVSEILEVEKEKYLETKESSKRIVAQMMGKEVSAEKLIELYDSQGINPDYIRQEFKANGKELIVPDNFYSLVAEKHKNSVQKTSTKKTERIELPELPATEALYFGDYKILDFSGKVLKIVEKDNKHYVILDKTAFYPTSGGQLSDSGVLGNAKVSECFKQGKLIVHVVENPSFREGEVIKGQVNFERRLQLSQHHTTAHIVNAASRKILGNHIWQAGASKTMEHGRLDITHYKQLEESELKKIEDEANSIVNANISIKKFFLPRNEAEHLYGFRLYQGGAVPGKEIRIVEIQGIDVEACGGTHLNSTGEAGKIKIIKSSKVQDGIIRLEFVSGKASENETLGEAGIIEELKKSLKCEREEIPGRVDELFQKWKKIVKKGEPKESFRLESKEKSSGSDKEIIEKASFSLKTQPEHLAKTVNRFFDEIQKK
jgi:alanyl-tRNA synthetase